MSYERKFNYFLLFLGLEFGSFANVCIYRWPRGFSILNPIRSCCPWCKNIIPWMDNIPVFSFIYLNRRCRNCQSPISWRYPLIELLLPIIWCSIVLMDPSRIFTEPILMVNLFFLGFVILVTSITDLDWKIIPDQCTYSLVLVGSAYLRGIASS